VYVTGCHDFILPDAPHINEILPVGASTKTARAGA